MKISNNTNKPAFKYGLTYQLFKDFKHINIKEAEADFAKIGVDANFLNNKFICGGSVLTADILDNIASKYKLPFDFLPPAIRAYQESNLAVGTANNCDGFCIIDTKRVLKDEPSFIGNSIFFNDINKSALKVNLKSIFDGMTKIISASHFLHTFLHEWFHCIHQNLIFQKYGYEGNCPVLKEQYSKQGACGLDILSKHDILFDALFNYQEDVGKLISDYAAEYCFKSEIFAELMSMITAKSLDRKLNPTKNPLDNLPKNLPLCIKNMVEELLNI